MSSANASPTLATLSRRLTSTSQLLLERSRVISLSMKPSASSTNTIVRNLTSIKRDLQQIEENLEHNGLRDKGKGKQGESEVEKQVREIGESYDRLVGMLGEDEAGRHKAKPLIREIPQSAAAQSASPDAEAEDPFTDDPTPPRISLEPPTPIVAQGQRNGDSPFLSRSGSQSATPFRDDPEDNARISDSEMVTQQQTMMDDQDERLNHLSNSINRQNQLSVQIGDELDVHHQLLEDTDGAMDRTQARLGRAKKRLDKVADEAKQYGSTITIVALIFILLILIIVFKT